MFFKKYFKKNIYEKLTETQYPVNTNKEVVEINPVSESSEDTAAQSLFGSSILFGKMKNLYSGPDMLYENEDWAPENEYIGLFRKRRAQIEEQPSSTVSE
jgi:hypothetical protein